MIDRPVSDLMALGEASTRDLPDMERSVSSARERGARSARRRRNASLIATFGVLALLVMPISSTRVVGDDLVLEVSGPADSTLADAVSREIRAVFVTRVVAVDRGPGDALRFAAWLPARAGMDVEKRARALARALERQGIPAHATVTPRRARASGSLYALARDHVLRIRGDGRTARELESEIRRRLEEEGLEARISVTDEPGRRRIEVETPETPKGGSGSPATLEIGLSGGSPGNAEPATRIDVTRTSSPLEGVILHVAVATRGRSVSIEVPHSEAMSQATLAREVEARLKAVGLDARATIERDGLKIELSR